MRLISVRQIAVRTSAVAAVAVLALVGACSDGPAAAGGHGGGQLMEITLDTADATPDPVVVPQVPAPSIVMLSEGSESVLEVAKSLMATYAPDAGARADSIVPLRASRGFVAPLTRDELSVLSMDPKVAYADEPRPVTADRRHTVLTEPAGAGLLSLTPQRGSVFMASTPWALDRMTQRALPLDNAAVFSGTGSGVTIYIIDTGVRGTHTEFGSRVTQGADFILGGTATGDCGGHGTKVASDAAGSTMGVARQAKIVSVRVLDCNGSGSSVTVVQGVDWVIAQVKANPGPAVINMSLGGGSCVPINDAVARAVAAGITTVVAAGNSNANACNFSPAGEPTVFTVGATDILDNRASFSNYGSCVDIYSPGQSVGGADHAGDNAYADWSGTSAASPFVAGVAALYLEQFPTATPAQVSAALAAGATTGAVKGTNVTNNRLVYLPASGVAGGGPATTPPSGFVSPPTAKAVITCDRRSCTFDGRTSTDSSAVTKWAWNFGNGKSGTGSTTTQKYAADGKYTVALTITNARGLTASRTDTVRIVDGAPTARATVVCTGWSCRFDATKSTDDGRLTKYTWAFGDGLSGSGASVTHNFKTGGSYSATLIVSDDIAQKDTAGLTATTTPRPPTAAATVSCNGRTCTFDATASKDDIGIASYTWDYLDGSLATTNPATKTYSTAGVKTFKLTVRNTNNLSTTVQGKFTLR